LILYAQRITEVIVVGMGRAVVAAVVIVVTAGSAMAETSRYYRTSGSARIETCRGIGFEVCSSETIAIPRFLDQSVARSAVWHEKRNDGLLNCFEELQRGIWTKKLLIFRCRALRGPP
jgi:hypothetical protein